MTPEEKEIIWDQYIKYLIGWANDKKDIEYFSMSPADFEEWLNNELEESSDEEFTRIFELIDLYKKYAGDIMYHQCAEGAAYFAEQSALRSAERNYDAVVEELNGLGITVEGCYGEWKFIKDSEVIYDATNNK